MSNTDIHLFQVSVLVNDNHVSIHNISEDEFIQLMMNSYSSDIRLENRNEKYFRLSLKLNGTTFFSGEIEPSKYEEMLKVYKFEV